MRRLERSKLPWGTGAAVISLDAEQIWGHLDLMSEAEFNERYPDAPRAYHRLLDALCSAGIPATWLVVGGLALDRCAGRRDPRMAGLPARWARLIPAGTEGSAPLWYRRSFIRRLKAAAPAQDIGLHGGLTHLIWTQAPREAVLWELQYGLQALKELSIRPECFAFPRNLQAHHDLLSAHGIRCYRGLAPTLSTRLGRTMAGALLRMAEEMESRTPPPVWPVRSPYGLWNVPASLFLYPVGQPRSRLVKLRTRVERVRRGLEAAARTGGIFHFCLHPANLAESPEGFRVFDEILGQFIAARERGDLEVLTMAEIVRRMEASGLDPSQEPAHLQLRPTVRAAATRAAAARERLSTVGAASPGRSAGAEIGESRR